MEYYLDCRFDSRKSFYNKAKIRVTTNGTKELTSYNTVVVKIEPDGKTAVVYGTYSATTLRHIKEFLKQNGFRADSKSQIMEDYGI